MEQRSSKEKLDDLPASTDKFWDGEVNVVEPKVPFMKQPHYFERVRGHEAQCTHCDWGFELDPGDKIEGGHLYSKQGKKII